MLYTIIRKHTEVYEIDIEANSEEEALEMAENQEINPDDYTLCDAGVYEYEVI